MNENSPLGLIKEIIGNLNNQLSLIYFIFIIFIFSSLQEKTFSQLRELMFAIIPVNIENYLIDIFSYHISITKFLLFINFIGWIPALIMLLIIGFSYFKNFSPDLFNNNILSNLLVLSQKYIHISFH
ncbi:hypothetical protein C7954_1461 [Halanaerobium congolense]|uniref:Uncharacterized protein n=1 Tax=Halanaerobium congolense TaxID=54121 RepID=A0A4R8G7U9_9FIRM|nr:hypothetical protein C7954_1461 [Halanaerobium congolense]